MKVNPVAVAFWLPVAGCFFVQFSLNRFQNNTIYLYFLLASLTAAKKLADQEDAEVF